MFVCKNESIHAHPHRYIKHLVIHAEHNLTETAREFKTWLYLAFVDLRKPIILSVLWMVLEKRHHLPGKLVHILKSLHEDTKGAVRVYGIVGLDFDVTIGVREGDMLTPVVFNLFLDAVIAAT